MVSFITNVNFFALLLYLFSLNLILINCKSSIMSLVFQKKRTYHHPFALATCESWEATIHRKISTLLSAEKMNWILSALLRSLITLTHILVSVRISTKQVFLFHRGRKHWSTDTVKKKKAIVIGILINLLIWGAATLF